MRASRLLAAVTAGFVSISAAAAEDKGVNPEKDAAARPSAAPVVAAATQQEDDRAGEATAAADAAVTPPVAPAADAGSQQVTADTPVKEAPAPEKPPSPTLIVKINLSSQSMTLSYGGARQETWKISSGREGYATPRGVFRPQWASKMWYSRKYDNAPMPNAVFFVGGVAVHGTQSIRMLGTPASHGCVRLAPANAARFYSLVHKHGYARTRIEVFGTPPPSRVARHRGHPTRDAVAASRGMYPSRMVSGGSYGGWNAPRPTAQFQRHPNGMIYLPPGSRLQGRETFVYNGVVYRRVR